MHTKGGGGGGGGTAEELKGWWKKWRAAIMLKCGGVSMLDLLVQLGLGGRFISNLTVVTSPEETLNTSLFPQDLNTTTMVVGVVLDFKWTQQSQESCCLKFMMYAHLCKNLLSQSCLKALNLSCQQ